MKIQNKLKRNLNIPTSKNNNLSKVTEKKDTFLEEFKRIHGEQITSKLDELLELIDEQGEKLSKHRTFDELVRYKKMIGNFVEEAVNKMYHLNEDYSTVKGKLYSLVETVDESLEELTEMVLSEQESQMEILDKLDEIRGLLVDLYT